MLCVCHFVPDFRFLGVIYHQPLDRLFCNLEHWSPRISSSKASNLLVNIICRYGDIAVLVTPTSVQDTSLRIRIAFSQEPLVFLPQNYTSRSIYTACNSLPNITSFWSPILSQFAFYYLPAILVIAPALLCLECGNFVHSH